MKLPASLAKKLDAASIQFLNQFLRNCPDTLLNKIISKTYPANYTLINTDDSCPFVYILLQGCLQAIEEHSVNEPYYYTEIPSIEIVGDFELFTNSTSRAVTLITLETSLCLIIPASDYLAWIQNDANALYIRTQMLIHQLMTKTRFDRQNLFLNNRSRLLHYLYSECCKTAQKKFPIKIVETRSEIASKLGCSLRTINRIIHSFQQEGLITLKAGKILVSDVQYDLIKEKL